MPSGFGKLPASLPQMAPSLSALRAFCSSKARFSGSEAPGGLSEARVCSSEAPVVLSEAAGCRSETFFALGEDASAQSEAPSTRSEAASLAGENPSFVAKPLSMLNLQKNDHFSTRQTSHQTPKT